jgi:hypothetical protein
MYIFFRLILWLLIICGVAWGAEQIINRGRDEEGDDNDDSVKRTDTFYNRDDNEKEEEEESIDGSLTSRLGKKIMDWELFRPLRPDTPR